MPIVNANASVVQNHQLTTKDVADSFEGFIKAADEDVEDFIADNTKRRWCTGNVSISIVRASTTDGRPKHCGANGNVKP